MTTKLDPVTLEVVRSALPAIATEMAADLHRTSYNMMIYEVRDFCTALLLPDARLVSQNVGGVSHFVADLGAIVEDGMNRYGTKGFKHDDVIITNHQAVAGQHLNNMVIYMPYFYKGELIMFSMVRAHWIDIGGISTGFGAGAEVIDPWQEGLQLDQLKIYDEGKVNEVLLKVIRDNIRFPDSSLGDMRAQMAACKLAHRRLDELFDKFGKQIMIEAIEHIFKETEMKCRRTVATFPSGVYEAKSFLDNDGVSKEPVRIHAKVTVDAEKGDMIIDLSGCSAARKAGINSRTLAGARVAYKSLTAPLDPVNEGSFNALKHVIPEGNIMMAQYPAPMAGWTPSSRPWSTPSSKRCRVGPRTVCRPPISARSARRWCSSAAIPRRARPSWCKASRAAAGAGVPQKMGSLPLCPCARATSATAASKRSR